MVPTRIIVLSDLHIKPGDRWENTTWASHFCKFMKGQFCSKSLILVLGDIIDNNGKQTAKEAFRCAANIFRRIADELSGINYKIAFIPGNHDYCDGSLDLFYEFSEMFRTVNMETMSPGIKRTCAFIEGDHNFILTDSICEGDYRKPGELDLNAISQCLRTDKENLLFMHHSLKFEDSSDHTGIINETKTIEFLEQNKIRFIFHGHAHATRCYQISEECRQFGSGSIGVEEERIGLDNEKEQFLQFQINGHALEAVVNWLWRGGSERYQKIQLYPESLTSYDDNLVPSKIYPKNSDYIARTVLPREKAESDEITRCFAGYEKQTLYDVCKLDQYVVLIADAGLGKTMELQELAYLISTGNKYARTAYISLNIYSANSLKDYIIEEIPEYRTIDLNTLVLILDGYDELRDEVKFKIDLLHFQRDYPGARICISMRSNFLSEVSEAFQEFEIYKLLELDSKDIESELEKHHVEKVKFSRECKLKGLRTLATNPFYLGKMIELFSALNDLPPQSELLKDFLRLQFEKDIKKFEFAKPVEGHQYEVERSLTRFAVGLQLLGRSSCDTNTYQSILTLEDREYIKHSSLVIRTTKGERFEHHMFKEFLVARYLSQKNFEEIIGQILLPNKESLNPHWVNILGLILQLREKRDVAEWTLDMEPLILTNLEPDRVSPKLRYSLLETELSNIERKNIWFRSEICSEKKLAAFVQSSDAVALLLEHIKNSAHFRGLYFALTVLKNFTELYGMEENTQSTLIGCYQNTETRPHEKCVAIAALASLHLENSNITDDLMERYSGTGSGYERLGVYEYLRQANLCDSHIEFILAGLENLVYSFQGNHDDSNGVDRSALVECLKSLSRPESLKRVFEWFCLKDHIEEAYDEFQEYIANLLDKAAAAYDDGAIDLFDAVYEVFVAVQRYHRIQYNQDLLAFFSRTKTMERAFAKFVNSKASERAYELDVFFKFRPDLIDVFCGLYEEDALSEPLIFKKFALRRATDKETFKKLAAIIQKKTGEIITQTTPINYEEQRQRDVQAFFDSLFDKSAMRILLNEFLNLYESQDMTFAELRECRVWHDTQPAGTKELETALLQSKLTDEKIADFLDLTDWNEFVLYSLYRLFQNENAEKILNIGENQKSKVIQIYKELEGTLNYHTAMTEISQNQYKLSSNLQYYIAIKRALNLDSPEEFYLGLLEVPGTCDGRLVQVSEKYEMLETHVSPDKIATRISELVQHETRISILAELMFGCNRYKIRSCKEIAIHICKRNDIQEYYRRNALEYIYNVFGAEVILAEIMTCSDEDQFRTIVGMISPESDNRLASEVIRRYREKKDQFLLKRLIAANVPEGLKIYIEESRKKNAICDNDKDFAEVTEAISTIKNVKMLPLLCDAVRLLFSDGFMDGGFNTLYNSLERAFVWCAQENAQRVLNAIRNLKIDLKEKMEAVGFCSLIEDEIIKSANLSFIPKFDVFQIRRTLQNLEI